MMKKKIQKFCIVALAAVSLLGITGCGAKGEDSEVSIGYFNNVTHPQALYMKSQKTLEDSLGTDKEVRWTAFNAGPAEVLVILISDISVRFPQSVRM